ncbi:hypothetical protein NMY22_g16845 [Coprinellus aureogranulatus]|nr:hypothetical protein NMY22_g16845 [Coprinellus aureogranulatus]
MRDGGQLVLPQILGDETRVGLCLVLGERQTQGAQLLDTSIHALMEGLANRDREGSELVERVVAMMEAHVQRVNTLFTVIEAASGLHQTAMELVQRTNFALLGGLLALVPYTNPTQQNTTS